MMREAVLINGDYVVRVCHAGGPEGGSEGAESGYPESLPEALDIHGKELTV